MDDLDTDSSGFGETMDAENSSRSGKWVMVAIVLAVVGILVGVAGVYLANQARKDLELYKAELAAKPDTTAESLATFKSETKASIDDMEGRLGNIGASIVRLNRQSGGDATKQLEDIRKQTQVAFDSVSNEVQANRKRINETNAQLKQLIESGVQARTAPAAPQPTSTAAVAPAETPVAVPEGATVHVVQPGEFMSVIARNYGVSLTALMAANPTIEPRRMMPGDKVIIPSKE
jgi:LysM repeat protein